MIAQDGIYSLSNGQEYEENGCQKGQESPWILEVLMLQICKIYTPIGRSIGLQVFPNLKYADFQNMVGVGHVVFHSIPINNAITQSVEKHGSCIATPQLIFHDSLVDKKPHVLSSVEESIHENEVRGDVAAGLGVHALEGDQAHELGCSVVVDVKKRQFENSSSFVEVYIRESAAGVLLEGHSCIAKPRRRW